MKKILRIFILVFSLISIGSLLTSCLELPEEIEEQEETGETVVDDDGTDTIELIKIGKVSSDFKYEDRKDVKAALVKKGFTNIVFNPVENTSLLASNGDVKSVSIDGSTKYSKSDKFMPDVAIIINYYAKKGDCINGFAHTWMDVEAVDDELIDCTHVKHDAGRVCEICGKTDYTEYRGDHNVVIDAGQEPGDCQHPGLTEGSHCSVCGEVITPQQEIAGEHSVVVDPYVAPTKTSNGLTEGTHCSVCGEVLVAQKTITWEGSSEQKAAIQALETVFPVETAKKAAVTIIENYLALDVFNEEGTDVDPTKYHTYGDKSGTLTDYYLWVDNYGVWSYQDENTWHCDKLKLTSYGTKSVFIRSFDITYDEGVYFITNNEDTRNVSESLKTIWDDEYMPIIDDSLLVGERLYPYNVTQICGEDVAGTSDYDLTLRNTTRNTINAGGVYEWYIVMKNQETQVDIPFLTGFTKEYQGAGIWITAMNVDVKYDGTVYKKVAICYVDLVKNRITVVNVINR